MPSVLIVDDEANIRRMVGALLVSEGFEVREAPDGNSGIARAEEREPDVVLLDLMMPGGPDGISVLEKMRERYPDLPVVMMSGRAGLSDAVRATKLGAAQFLEKPLTPEGLLLAMQSGMELRQARNEARTLRRDLGLENQMIGTSPPMQAVRKLIETVAPSDARILIEGESGTGKELVAAAIHLASPRRDRPFVRVNCAAIPRDLVESEMFGHERGAFTGATERRIGRFELAHRGTLFLDEVGDLHLEAQAKLLRAIESHEIERLGAGSHKPTRVDVRIVAATNKDLKRAVSENTFREDLLFRLNVIPMVLPPLRERPSDIPALVEHFSDRYRLRSARAIPHWDKDAMALLIRYRWPGNVRELANIVERLSILNAGKEVDATDVLQVLHFDNERDKRQVALPDPEKLDAPLTETLDEFERMLIRRALDAAGGNIAEAARNLQTDRPNLYRRMRRLGLVEGP